MPEVLETPPVEAAPDAGMSRFMSDVTKDIDETTPTPQQPEATPPADPAKPTEKSPEKPAEKPPEKPAAKPAEKPAAQTKPKAEDNGTLRKRLEETLAADKTKTEEINKLSTRIKELENKRVYSDDDDAKVKKYEARIQELETGISEVAYERSTEFKQKFVDPWQNTVAAALKFTESLTVTVDADGTTRKATADDFWKVAGLPPSHQAEAAQQLFGVNAVRILNQIDRIQDIKAQSDVALKTHRESSGEKQKQTEESRAKEQRLYEDTRATAMQELRREYPQFFDADPNDPEITAQLEAGYDYVDKATENMSNMPVADRAAYAAVLRARAAYFPRAVHEIKSLKSEVDSLKAEVAKLRGTDPGNVDDKGVPAAAKKDEVPTGGVAALTDEKIWQ